METPVLARLVIYSFLLVGQRPRSGKLPILLDLDTFLTPAARGLTPF